MRQERSLDINIFTNALDLLEKGGLFLSMKSDAFRWKWLAICLTDAVYGFMIAALAGDNNKHVVASNSMSKRENETLRFLNKHGSSNTHLLVADELSVAWNNRALGCV